MEEFFDDYPTEPIGSGNPYYRCIYCKRSDPEINMRLNKHLNYCEYRIQKEEEIEFKEMLKNVFDFEGSLE